MHITRRSIAVSLIGFSLLAEPARIRPVDELNVSLNMAIAAGDMQQVKVLLEEGASPDSRDREGTPALMNAALYGSAAMMKLLLERGADVNAKNEMDATALHWAAGDPAKARLLLEKGAKVNVTSKLGRTPLMVAASVAGNAPTVKMLLDRGASVDGKDNIAPIPVIPAGGGGGTALIDACRSGDEESVRMLIEAGASVNATDSRGGSALSEAVMYGRADLVSVLLSKGADPSGSVSALKFPYLTMAAMRGGVRIASMLYEKNAPVNATDAAGNTPLMFAAGSDRNQRALVTFLLNRGAEVNAKNKAGETALDWALRRGETPVARLLRQAGAQTGVTPAAAMPGEPMGDVSAVEAVTKAMASLAKTGTHRKTGCATCHNHTLPMTAAAAAAAKGIKVDDEAVRFMTRMTTAMVTPAAPALLEGTGTFPDLGITGGYLTEGLRAQGYGSSRATAALVHNLAQSQLADGRWVGWAPRPPIESGDIQATAMSIRALRLYPIPGRKAEMDERIARARVWLMRAKPATTEEYIMRLEGLREAGASKAIVTDAARQLAMLQRDGGGWAQLPGLEPDAYATGKAMVALARARVMDGHNAKAAERFLRSTQLADGTWRVATRVFPFQPLVDAGFPHGRDQWISAAGTSWAAQALAMNLR